MTWKHNLAHEKFYHEFLEEIYSFLIQKLIPVPFLMKVLVALF